MAGDDAYDMGRWAFQFNHALLVGLRVTGDLEFLDAVDRVTESIRAQLRDGWCDGVDSSLYVNVRYGTVHEPDGHLNLRLRTTDGATHYCRDTGDLNEGLAHGHLALIMYAYHVNRHSQSPNGIDYAERADFWLDYLRNHFEAKWRQRSNTVWPDMDFIDLKFCHTYHQMLLYYAYVGFRLQDESSPDAAPYLQQVLRLTDSMFDFHYRAGREPGGFINVSTPIGDAVVFPFGSPGTIDESSTLFEACPVTYSRYMVSSVLNLYLEGVPRWDDDIMTKLANGLAHFVMDTGILTERPDPFAAGVSGDGTVANLPPTEYRERVSVRAYAVTPFAALAAWDDSGTVSRVSAQAYEIVEPVPESPESVYLPAGALLATALNASSVDW